MMTDLVPGNDVTAAMLVFQIKRILIRPSGTPIWGNECKRSRFDILVTENCFVNLMSCLLSSNYSMFKIIQKFSSGITVESNFVLGGAD
jgi:hypothetical protein